MEGCNQITAINFNASATEWDRTCSYLIYAYDKVNAVMKCLHFVDLEEEEVKDNSFTVSLSAASQNWVFYHDYIPDFYFHTRDKIFNLEDKLFYEMNVTNTYGTYKEGSIQPFFIDVVFKLDTNFITNAVSWISDTAPETTDMSGRGDEWNTLTHISIWNSQQHTGEIPIQDVQSKARKTNGVWRMNDFRNVLKERGTQFISDLFNDYALDISKTAAKDWYKKELIVDNYVVVRFTYDNTVQKRLFLQEVSLEAIKTIR